MQQKRREVVWQGEEGKREGEQVASRKGHLWRQRLIPFGIGKKERGAWQVPKRQHRVDVKDHENQEEEEKKKKTDQWF